MTKADLKYLIAYVGPLLGYYAIWQGGVASYSGFFLAFFFIPTYELIVGSGSHRERTDSDNEKRRTSPYFDLLLYSHIPLLFGMIYWYLLKTTSSVMEWWEYLGMTLTIGIFVGTFGINVAHELGHRKKPYERLMSKILLLPALYMHFYIEHNRGHHRHVATRHDPATARYGESIYRFWLRSIWGGLRSAWQLEVKRLTKSESRGPNQMVLFTCIQLAYLAGVGILFGWKGVESAVLIAVIGMLLLEGINYIEHYGLLRKKSSNGTYERVGREHSWESNHDLGRIFLYELTHHAHHHYHASTKYQGLLHSKESPQLPTGYPGMIILSLVPPLFFKVMNDRVPPEMRQRSKQVD